MNLFLTHKDLLAVIYMLTIDSTMRTSVLPMKSDTSNSLRSLKHRLVSWVCTFSAAIILSPAVFGQGATIRFAGDSDVGEGGRWTRAAAEEWAKKTGNKVEYVSRPNDASATLQQFQQVLGGQESRYRLLYGRRHLARHPRAACRRHEEYTTRRKLRNSSRALSKTTPSAVS